MNTYIKIHKLSMIVLHDYLFFFESFVDITLICKITNRNFEICMNFTFCLGHYLFL